jgi:CheY-like chemotaxis protein
MVLDVVKRMLEGMGFQVLCVSDGREALETFRTRAAEIVCVLLDCIAAPAAGRRQGLD